MYFSSIKSSSVHSHCIQPGTGDSKIISVIPETVWNIKLPITEKGRKQKCCPAAVMWRRYYTSNSTAELYILFIFQGTIGTTKHMYIGFKK